MLLTLPGTTVRPLGNVSMNCADRLAGVALALLKVMVSVENPPALMVAGLKDLPSVGGVTTPGVVGVLTVKVATAGAALLPLLVCKAPAGSELTKVPAVRHGHVDRHRAGAVGRDRACQQGHRRK